MIVLLPLQLILFITCACLHAPMQSSALKADRTKTVIRPAENTMNNKQKITVWRIKGEEGTGYPHRES